MTAKEYPEPVAGQASVYRLDTFELTVEFSYSRQFKAEYLSYLEIGQQVRVPLYTTPPSVDALIADAIEKHDDEMAYAKTVNMRTQAQPYLDELIAEIDGLPVHHFHEKTEKRFINLKSLDKAIDKYRSAK